jgi:hypothetical protein
MAHAGEVPVGAAMFALAGVALGVQAGINSSFGGSTSKPFAGAPGVCVGRRVVAQAARVCAGRGRVARGLCGTGGAVLQTSPLVRPPVPLCLLVRPLLRTRARAGVASVTVGTVCCVLYFLLDATAISKQVPSAAAIAGEQR